MNMSQLNETSEMLKPLAKDHGSVDINEIMITGTFRKAFRKFQKTADKILPSITQWA